MNSLLTTHVSVEAVDKICVELFEANRTRKVQSLFSNLNAQYWEVYLQRDPTNRAAIDVSDDDSHCKQPSKAANGIHTISVGFNPMSFDVYPIKLFKCEQTNSATDVLKHVRTCMQSYVDDDDMSLCAVSTLRHLVYTNRRRRYTIVRSLINIDECAVRATSEYVARRSVVLRLQLSVCCWNLTRLDAPKDWKLISSVEVPLSTDATLSFSAPTIDESFMVPQIASLCFELTCSLGSSYEQIAGYTFRGIPGKSNDTTEFVIHDHTNTAARARWRVVCEFAEDADSLVPFISEIRLEHVAAEHAELIRRLNEKVWAAEHAAALAKIAPITFPDDAVLEQSCRILVDQAVMRNSTKPVSVLPDPRPRKRRAAVDPDPPPNKRTVITIPRLSAFALVEMANKLPNT